MATSAPTAYCVVAKRQHMQKTSLSENTLPATDPDTPFRILWRDEHLIAIYKPAAWLVHRTGLDAGETRFVVQTLRDQIDQHVYPLHRLDKGTCGVLLLALHPEAASRARVMFETHTIRKRYLAMVRGFAPLHSDVDHALRPDDAPADAPAQPAQTQLCRLATLDYPQAYEPRFTGTRLSLVQALPHTGRRHQIRRIHGIRIGMTAPEIRQRRSVNNGPGRRAKTLLKDCMRIRSGHRMHGVKAHAELGARKQTRNSLKIEQ